MRLPLAKPHLPSYLLIFLATFSLALISGKIFLTINNSSAANTNVTVGGLADRCVLN